MRTVLSPRADAVLRRVQGDGLAYVHDSADRSPVQVAYEKSVRGLAEDSDYVFITSDVPTGRAEDFAMPAPVRYRSTAAVYEEGGADRCTTTRRRLRRSP
ncbi:hypothetical protein [Actinacidiphila sp. ITFR-21]|uniref:hypothetical protein n=1 Tax=Actinacidiphila sp. ITFR-21 TaxID=3075199 RepID=UPI00288C4661|nr:hypothetical protein [Streptomyces sp. ITFR-21]WNI19972.1 hypothetical protein RLT57_31000 [Streptomyces sp. ITFR-21]